ncbi:hypothetical protein ACIBRY_28015 [Streptomyces anulatus]
MTEFLLAGALGVTVPRRPAARSGGGPPRSPARLTGRETEALGQCTVSAGNPQRTGDHVRAEAPWPEVTLGC